MGAGRSWPGLTGGWLNNYQLISIIKKDLAREKKNSGKTSTKKRENVNTLQTLVSLLPCLLSLVSCLLSIVSCPFSLLSSRFSLLSSLFSLLSSLFSLLFSLLCPLLSPLKRFGSKRRMIHNIFVTSCTRSAKGLAPFITMFRHTQWKARRQHAHLPRRGAHA